MRLAISNIAWDISEDEEIATLLKKYDVDAIDIAPGKYFPDLGSATEADIAKVKQWWVDRDIEITGMQALLFGTEGLNVFGCKEVQDSLLEHLTKVCRIGSHLGASRLVFGSPKNRDRSGLTDQEALEIAIPFFRKLGDIAQSYGVLVCLEPNPKSYGANFMTNSLDTASVIRSINHPAIKMQFDTGSLAINGEDPDVVLQNCAPLIGHVHASEPDLLPLGDLGDHGTKHINMFKAIKRYLPKYLVSIEMVATKNEAHRASIERAIQVATNHYRRDQNV